jgi:hypothetical protein
MTLTESERCSIKAYIETLLAELLEVSPAMIEAGSRKALSLTTETYISAVGVKSRTLPTSEPTLLTEIYSAMLNEKLRGNIR